MGNGMIPIISEGPGATPIWDQAAFDAIVAESTANRFAERLFWHRVSIAIVIVLFVAAIVVWRRRREIWRTSGERTIATAAAGVRAKRRLSARLSALRQKIIDRADAG